MGRAVLAVAGDHSDPHVDLAAGGGTGADLFLWRKIKTSLAQIVATIVTLTIVSSDVTDLAESSTSTTQITEGQAHARKLSIFTDVTPLPVDLLWCDWSVAQEEVGRVFRTIMHPGSFVGHAAASRSLLDLVANAFAQNIAWSAAASSSPVSAE